MALLSRRERTGSSVCPSAESGSHRVFVPAELLEQFFGEVFLAANPGLGGDVQQVGGRPGGALQEISAGTFHVRKVGQHRQ